VSLSPNPSHAGWSPTEMPQEDHKIGLADSGEDAAGVMDTDTWQRTALIGRPLSLQDIREGPKGLFRISAPPPSPELTGGGPIPPVRQYLILNGTV
jgi:hypothetical protein